MAQHRIPCHQLWPKTRMNICEHNNHDEFHFKISCKLRIFYVLWFESFWLVEIKTHIAWFTAIWKVLILKSAWSFFCEKSLFWKYFSFENIFRRGIPWNVFLYFEILNFDKKEKKITTWFSQVVKTHSVHSRYFSLIATELFGNFPRLDFGNFWWKLRIFNEKWTDFSPDGFCFQKWGFTSFQHFLFHR